MQLIELSTFTLTAFSGTRVVMAKLKQTFLLVSFWCLVSHSVTSAQTAGNGAGNVIVLPVYSCSLTERPESSLTSSVVYMSTARLHVIFAVGGSGITITVALWTIDSLAANTS